MFVLCDEIPLFFSRHYLSVFITVQYVHALVHCTRTSLMMSNNNNSTDIRDLIVKVDCIQIKCSQKTSELPRIMYAVETWVCVFIYKFKNMLNDFYKCI